MIVIGSILPQWVQEDPALAWWLGAVSVASVVLFIGTLAVIPVLVARIPADYFVRGSAVAWGRRHPVLRAAVVVSKNAVGGVLLIAGMAMLVLPGQGLLTILVAVLLLDFPRKRAFELWLVQRRPIRRGIDWIRRRRGKPPLELPSD